MTIEEARLKWLEMKCQQTVKGFRIAFKDQSFWQKVIGVLMFFNRKYMTDYISTFFPRVYWPTENSYKEDPVGSFEVLAHEWIHLIDDKNNRGWFGFSYLSFQVWSIVSILALLAIWFGAWYLLFLVGLVFLAPWPSPWRLKWEVRGYSMGMAIEYWKHGRISEQTISFIVSNLTGPDYYFIWWSKRGVRKRLGKVILAIRSGEIFDWSEGFKGVHEIVMASDSEVLRAVNGVE